MKFGKHILLRDFRTVKNGEVINFNIGTAAHAPGTLAVLKKYLGKDVRITVWADAPLSEPLAKLMRRHFPDVDIVSGRLDGSESAAPTAHDEKPSGQDQGGDKMHRPPGESVLAKHLVV